MSDGQISYVTLGFLQLLGDQLSLSVERAHVAEKALKDGRKEAALEALSGITKTMENAELSRTVALQLLEK